jgi:hypothetical protein
VPRDDLLEGNIEIVGDDSASNATQLTGAHLARRRRRRHVVRCKKHGQWINLPQPTCPAYDVNRIELMFICQENVLN